MTEETQATPRPQRTDDHAGAAANPEEHLRDAHKLSIQVQGKEGPTGRAVWALIREEKGKVKTLTVFEGTRREAANRFFAFIHPNMPAQAAAPSRRPSRGPRTAPPRPSTGGRPPRRP